MTRYCFSRRSLRLPKTFFRRLEIMKNEGVRGGFRGFSKSVGCYHSPVDAFLKPALSFRPSPLVRLHGLLAAERQFAVALPEAERMAGLNRRFAGVVPPSVARTCSVAAIQGETAIVFCGNGAAASRVRAQAKGVAKALSRPDAPVGSVRVKVRADWSVPERPEKRDMSVAGVKAFRELDAALPEGGLKAAVERLLAHHRGRP
jgi:hypothetical protein